MSAERRKLSRIQFDAQTLITNSQGQCSRSQLLDVSFKGVLISRPEPPWHGALGDPVSLEILFGNSDTVLQCDAEIAHIEDHSVGFRILRLDIDSAAHLRRLIELNLGDAELLNREFSALVSAR